MRLLGDRVSRRTAWRIAREQDWDTLRDAEYLAVTRLQADALTVDARMAALAVSQVPVAPVDALFAAEGCRLAPCPGSLSGAGALETIWAGASHRHFSAALTFLSARCRVEERRQSSHTAPEGQFPRRRRGRSPRCIPGDVFGPHPGGLSFPVQGRSSRSEE